MPILPGLFDNQNEVLEKKADALVSRINSKNSLAVSLGQAAADQAAQFAGFIASSAPADRPAERVSYRGKLRRMFRETEKASLSIYFRTEAGELAESPAVRLKELLEKIADDLTAAGTPTDLTGLLIEISAGTVQATA